MNTNRRNFIKGFGGLAAASALGGCKTSGLGFNCACRTYQGEKLKFGIIGAGGKGWTDWRNMFWHGELPVAICDVDRRWIQAGGRGDDRVLLQCGDNQETEDDRHGESSGTCRRFERICKMKKESSICIVVSAGSLIVAAVFHRYFPGFGAAYKPLLWPLIVLPFAVRFRYAVLTGAVVPFLSSVVNGMPTAAIALKLSFLTVCLMSGGAAVRAVLARMHRIVQD